MVMKVVVVVVDFFLVSISNVYNMSGCVVSLFTNLRCSREFVNSDTTLPVMWYSLLIYRSRLNFCCNIFILVRTKIGPFATPDIIQNSPGLPKTRSGKIMRRVLRKVAKNEKNIGDVTTMADSSVVDNLFENRPHVDFIHE